VSATVKSVIVAGLGLLFALILGSQIGQSSWRIPLAVAIFCAVAFIYVAFFRTVRLEALILSFLVFGYIVGNRGFAELRLTNTSPVYLGEAGLLACAFLVLARRALTREQLIPRTPLAAVVLAFLFAGGIRLYFDTVMTNSSAAVMVAIRDSAVVYYVLFFFIAYQIGRSPTGRKCVEMAMLFGFILLIPVAATEIWAPSILNRLTVRGYPVIFYKGDLLATFLGIGAFYFFLTPSAGTKKVFFRTCSLASLVLMLLPMSRAALSGFVCATLLLVAAKRPQFIMYQVGIAVVALFAIAFLQLSNVRFESDFFRSLSDRVSSIVDFSGTGHYHSEIGNMSVGNNEFRTVWWTTVFNETMQKGPFFGLGFGYDLTARFMQTYYLTGGEDTASTRSPHSILFTVLGRMGLFGLALFLIVIFLIGRKALFAARCVAKGKQPQETLIPWCAVITLLIASMFGVVLEGPMGGILFWTFLGLASSQMDIKPEEVRQKPAELANKKPRQVELLPVR
jgi:hypothetical protein